MIQTLLVLAPLCLPAVAQKKEPAAPPAAPGTSKTFPDLGLTITFPASFTEVKEERYSGSNQLRQRWNAKLGSLSLQIDLWAIPIDAKFQFEEPEDVMDVLLYNNLRDVSGGDSSFSFEDQRLVPGNFGVCPYASLARGAMHDREGTQETGTRFLLGGMLEKFGYSLELTATPLPGLDAMKELVHFLEGGISYKGPVRDPKWSEAEAKQRWTRDAPEKLEKKLEQIVRTQHYIIFTDSGSKTTCEKFGEQMEKNYEAIRKVFPFDEIPGRKLMPLFLFLNEDGYYEFFAKNTGMSEEEARKSKGVAHGDWYATYFEAKNDPVHIHEGTHQIFSNRLRLPGGGSWFQEGVAEYMSSSKNDRNVAANMVKKGKNVPLVDFVKIRSLLFSPKDDKKGGDEAASHYDLASLLIEFLHESKFGKDKFQDFVHAVGLAAPNSPAAIERAVKSVYLTDLAGLEKQWVEYCKKR
jgi:hypothetical protein